MTRSAELRAIVKPEVSDRKAEQEAERLGKVFDSAGKIAPTIDSNKLQRKLEQAIPGGGLLGSAIDRVRGGGGATAGGGASTTTLLASINEQLDDIHETLERHSMTEAQDTGSSPLSTLALAKVLSDRSGVPTPTPTGTPTPTITPTGALGLGASALGLIGMQGGAREMNQWLRQQGINTNKPSQRVQGPLSPLKEFLPPWLTTGKQGRPPWMRSGLTKSQSKAISNLDDNEPAGTPNRATQRRNQQTTVNVNSTVEVNDQRQLDQELNKVKNQIQREIEDKIREGIDEPFGPA